MSHTPHQISDEFPEHREKIRALRLGNAHFAKLLDEYEVINRDVHRMEERIEPVDEATEHAARKHRVVLKDEISAMLQKG